jgi:hypothetical protein
MVPNYDFASTLNEARTQMKNGLRIFTHCDSLKRFLEDYCFFKG